MSVFNKTGVTTLLLHQHTYNQRHAASKIKTGIRQAFSHSPSQMRTGWPFLATRSGPTNLTYHI